METIRMSWFSGHIEKKGEKIAIIYNDEYYTYAQLAAQIKDYTSFVKTNIPQGEVVALISDYSFESIAFFFALAENRNIIVPVASKIRSETDERIRIANCSYSISIVKKEPVIVKNETPEGVHSLIGDLKQKNHSGLILFSSGTSGAPKAMIHDLDNLLDSYKHKKQKELIFLILLMFDHIGGLNTLLTCLSTGVTSVIPGNREPGYVCSLIEKYHVNVLPASPTFLNLILISGSEEKHDLSSLKMITYGTEPMPDSLLLKLKDAFPRVKFLQTFGTSETGISQITSKSSASNFMKFGDPDTEFKIVDSELWIRSKTQILGYLNSGMEHFTEDGWFRTGDIVEESDDGYIKIIGRNKDIINVGGEKVVPSEVESVLLRMPGIKDCIVYGEFNPITGQMVVAKVLFEETVKASELKKLITNFCNGKIERYKIPAKIVLAAGSEFSERFKKKRN